MTDPFSPLTFAHGPGMKNRFMLAPLTNLQSNPDGTLGDDEFKWLTMRAQGGFGLTMTCASHVQAQGLGFPGQLGCFGDQHIPGLTRLAEGIHKAGSVAALQLHHAGMRSPAQFLEGPPRCPSDNEETGAKGFSAGEVEELAEDFIRAAERAKEAGFDGAELHGAHGYVLAQFLSPTINQRDDQWGGTIENRSRIVFDIIDGMRERCGPDFTIGLRLSPERFDLQLEEILWLAGKVMKDGKIDYLDMSLWDSFKEPEEEAFKGRSLMSYFTELERGDVRLGAAGKIRTPQEVQSVLDQGCDYVLLGRAAIVHHDFPELMKADPGFQPLDNPVSVEHLRAEGLGDAFVQYMQSWPGFVAEEA